MASLSGYERPPLGRLLAQVIKLPGRVGFVYERSIGFEKGMHTHRRHMLVCPRGSCRMHVELANGTRYKIDSKKLLWVPRQLPHSDHGQSAIYDVAALFPGRECLSSFARECGLSTPEILRIESQCIFINRTKWLDDLLEKYFFERVIETSQNASRLAYIEDQIFEEFARVAFNKGNARRQASVLPLTESPLAFEKALRFLEANLFQPITTTDVAAAAHTSHSTLLRAFKAETGLRPYEYLRKRRLDESLNLLKTGDYAIGDIALLVGYEDFSSFSRAFLKEYGMSPRAVARS